MLKVKDFLEYKKKEELAQFIPVEIDEKKIISVKRITDDKIFKLGETITRFKSNIGYMCSIKIEEFSDNFIHVTLNQNFEVKNNNYEFYKPKLYAPINSMEELITKFIFGFKDKNKN